MGLGVRATTRRGGMRPWRYEYERVGAMTDRSPLAEAAPAGQMHISQCYPASSRLQPPLIDAPVYCASPYVGAPRVTVGSRGASGPACDLPADAARAGRWVDRDDVQVYSGCNHHSVRWASEMERCDTVATRPSACEPRTRALPPVHWPRWRLAPSSSHGPGSLSIARGTPCGWSGHDDECERL
jgi:hypothetical protein